MMFLVVVVFLTYSTMTWRQHHSLRSRAQRYPSTSFWHVNYRAHQLSCLFLHFLIHTPVTDIKSALSHATGLVCNVLKHVKVGTEPIIFKWVIFVLKMRMKVLKQSLSIIFCFVLFAHIGIKLGKWMAEKCKFTCYQCLSCKSHVEIKKRLKSNIKGLCNVNCKRGLMK